MISNEKFGIIGGDLRQLYLAKKIQNDGNEVFVCGFDKTDKPSKLNLKTLNLNDLISVSKYIIFPVPVTRNGLSINAPFSSANINIDENLRSKIKNKVVFGRIISLFLEDVNKHDFLAVDYYEKEEFIMKNALLTAEGAVKIALEESGEVIFGKKCLVVGYGRIGKMLSKLLKNMGARVTVSARSEKDIITAKLSGLEALNISKIDEPMGFDLIFNTVPAVVLDYKALNFLKNSGLIIDLASLPGGVDKKAAENLGLRFIHALGIPGKYFPKSAGKVIADVIYKVIKEENL